MATDYSIDIDAGNIPSLAELADEVHRTNQPRLLRRADEAIAVLMPAPKQSKSAKRAKPVTSDDPLFRLIGIGRSEVEGGISDKKHEHLLRAKRSHA